MGRRTFDPTLGYVPYLFLNFFIINRVPLDWLAIAPHTGMWAGNIILFLFGNRIPGIIGLRRPANLLRSHNGLLQIKKYGQQTDLF
jgi:hypothetical protein